MMGVLWLRETLHDIVALHCSFMNAFQTQEVGEQLQIQFECWRSRSRRPSTTSIRAELLCRMATITAEQVTAHLATLINLQLKRDQGASLQQGAESGLLQIDDVYAPLPPPHEPAGQNRL